MKRSLLIFSDHSRGLQMFLGNKIVLCVLIFLSSKSSANSATTFEARYQQTRAKEITLPETCKSPYREAPNFLEFFNTSLYVMAAQRGANSQGIVELFAVEKLRDHLREVYPTLGEESPLDRLITAQLCQFEKIRLAKQLQTTPTRIVIAPTDADLQEHLISIAPRLYKDARSIVVEAMAQRAKDEKKDNDIVRQWNEVKKARRLGVEKVSDLVEKSK